MLISYASLALDRCRIRPSSVFLLSQSFRFQRAHSEAMSSSEPPSDTFDKLKTDHFRGVTVCSENETNQDVATFTTKLDKSISRWQAEGKKTIWFHVSRSCSQWLPVLCANAFRFHHVSNDGDVVVMYRWLLEDRPSAVPPYAHTMVGVGGIVLNANGELLVVLQKYGSRELLKLPGGYVEPQENLSDAAIREVEEETGVKTKFLSCFSFRHTHCANFGCSDLYFIVHLEPLSVDTNSDSDEVVDVRWMPVDDFLNDPKVHSVNRLFITTFMQNKEKGIGITKDDGMHPISRQPYSFYHITDDSESSSKK